MDPEELAVYARPRALRWERVAAAPPRAPTPREEEIREALASFPVLSSAQLARRFMPGATPRTVRKQLHELTAQGWARRAHLVCAGPGQTPRLFSARERELDAAAAVRALYAAAWCMALERAGARARITADADLALDLPGTSLLVEIGGWRPSLRDLLCRHAGGADPVVFVLGDQRSALRLARYADGLLSQGRERFLFAHRPDRRAVALAGSPGDELRLTRIGRDHVRHGR